MREFIRHEHCPMCGNDQSLIKVFNLTSERNAVLGIDDLAIYRCGSCNQVFLNPWVKGSEFEDSISVTAKTDDTAKKEGFYDADDNPVFEKFAASYPELLELANAYFDKGVRTIDLGCGVGLSTLALMTVWGGKKVYAIEANKHLAAAAIDHGISCQCCLFEQFDGEKYQQATLNSVIEHIHEPLKTLIDIRTNVLTSDAKIIVTCPNIDSTQTISEGASFNQFHWGHVWYFSEETLNNLMTSAGFELESWYRPNFDLKGIDGNIKTYFELLKGWKYNIYGACAGVFKVKG